MKQDDRDTLDILKAELNFIEKGGYGRSVLTPWKPTSMFRDSPICLNYCDMNQTHPCEECLLIDFVPPEQRRRRLPCHHIPLNEARETIESIVRREDQLRLEEAVKGWLRVTLKRLDEERAANSSPA